MSVPEPGFTHPAGLIDALNGVVLAVTGVSELYPPKSALRSTADQLVAFVRGSDEPPVRTVAIEEVDGGLKVVARVGVDAEHGTPRVVMAVAAAIREFVASEINHDVQCVASVQAVSIQ